ncbi:hypothetical protein PAPHI01_0809 [Pancytospora philotis]|nr:hypothetical protein PAPHI01_0809 [Pancytospora philotis]
MLHFLERLNAVLKSPTDEGIFALFDRDGFVRFNMLYISPVSIRHFKQKLMQYGLRDWYFTEGGLVFELADGRVVFKGALAIVGAERIFSVELDFDAVPGSDADIGFLSDIEIFLKKCDSCFFMTYFMSIDAEILSAPLSKSIDFLFSRK